MSDCERPTHAQDSVLDQLCLDHGTCEVSMLRCTAGLLMYVDCDDGTRYCFDEYGQPTP